LINCNAFSVGSATFGIVWAQIIALGVCLSQTTQILWDIHIANHTSKPTAESESEIAVCMMYVYLCVTVRDLVSDVDQMKSVQLSHLLQSFVFYCFVVSIHFYLFFLL